MVRAKTRGEQRRPLSHELGATSCHMTCPPKEGVETTDHRGHEGCGYNPRPPLSLCTRGPYSPPSSLRPLVARDKGPPCEQNNDK